MHDINFENLVLDACKNCHIFFTYLKVLGQI